MKDIKTKYGSYIHNITLIRRLEDESDAVFDLSEDNIKVKLNGYAIIPIDEYMKIKGESQDNINKTLEAVRKFDELLK